MLRRIANNERERGSMSRRVIQWALVICIGAVVAAEAVGQTPGEPATPQTQAAAPDMTGWNRVGELRDGRRITVNTGSGFPIHCIFRGITDHSLFCDQGSFLLGLDHREIARDQVAWLRTDNAPRDRAIMVGATGGACAVLGAVTADTDSLRPLGALLGGSIGMGVGSLASIPMALSMPGKTIYLQPGPPAATHPVHLRWPAFKKRPARQAEPAPTE
jgi:hypothetical protein